MKGCSDNPDPRHKRGFWFLVSLIVGASVQAAPYRPADDAQILVQLPASVSLARGLGATKRSADSAARLAEIFIKRARITGDPRDLGHAQGLLAPWWNQENPPERVLLMRATLRQSRHEFADALRDLDRLLARRPHDAQAHLTRATILRAQGRYAEARAACAELHGYTHVFVATLCTQSLRGLNGELKPAAAALQLLRAGLRSQPQAIAAWYYAEAADLAVRAGDARSALALYQSGLRRARDDHDLRAAYADLLLEQQRAAEALVLVEGATIEALRLREALALKALNHARFAQADAALREGFAAARRRGEDPHLREEARYALEVQQDAPAALSLAQQNFSVQREPVDARLLLAAAAAANRPEMAEPVRRWLDESRLQDVRLTPWLRP